MRTGKQKDIKLANRNKIAWGFFLATTQPYSTCGTAGAFEFFECQTPLHPLFRSLCKLPAPCRIRKVPGS